MLPSNTFYRLANPGVSGWIVSGLLLASHWIPLDSSLGGTDALPLDCHPSSSVQFMQAPPATTPPQVNTHRAAPPPPPTFEETPVQKKVHTHSADAPDNSSNVLASTDSRKTNNRHAEAKHLDHDHLDAATPAPARTPQADDTVAILPSEGEVVIKRQARMALSAEQGDRAYHLLRNSLKRANEDIEHVGLLSVAALQTGRFAEAEVLYRYLLNFDNDEARWWMGLATALDEQGLDASEAYRQVLVTAQTESKLHQLASHWMSKQMAWAGVGGPIEPAYGDAPV